MDINRIIKEYARIIIGTFLMAVAITVFFDPYSLVTGGVTGLAIVIKGFFNAPLWLSNAILNIPLFLLGIKVNGKNFLFKTFVATIMLSFMLWLARFLPVINIDGDLALAAIFGGTISGVGLGLIFSAGSTTGGTDLAASILHNFLRHISISKLLFLMDSIVIVLGLFTFGYVNAMYAIISVFITSRVIDTILEGLSFAKAALIISDESEKISKKIMEQLGRGVTALSGRGMYTGNRKDVVLCVTSLKEITKLKDIVGGIDKNAFVIVGDVKEVMGEGFSTMGD